MEAKTIKILECFKIGKYESFAEIQHSEDGIPPETQVYNQTSNETWIVKKRVFHGILILTNSEKYFECETETSHVDAVFANNLERSKAIEKELEKRNNGIYLYLIKPINKKQRIKPENGCILRIKTKPKQRV
ncbi:hypothetical protein [Psychroserpens sp. MEBiC05023]